MKVPINTAITNRIEIICSYLLNFSMGSVKNRLQFFSVAQGNSFSLVFYLVVSVNT